MEQVSDCLHFVAPDAVMDIEYIANLHSQSYNSMYARTKKLT